MDDEPDDTRPAGVPVDDAPTGAPARFADELIRPFVIGTLSVLTLIQLAERPPDRLPWLTWSLVVVTITAGLASSVLPWRPLTPRTRITLVSVFMAAGAMAFPLAKDTAAPALVFLASVTAGEKLDSRRVAFTVVGAGTALATTVNQLAGALHLSYESPWWLSLIVGLPLYIGLARRERADALAAADLAARQSRRAAASEAREAALEERGRIAREIHDVLGHALSGIAVQLDMADALHAGGRDRDANEAVRRARALAVSGIGETRRAIHALREDTLPLPETIARIAHGSTAGFEIQGEPGEVRVEVAQAVIRTAQEAITNAHRHAPGGEVNLLLAYTDRLVRLTVTDTGTAEPDARPNHTGSGMGLVGMRERASLLGGTLYAGPAEPPAPGWTVRLELPR
ncbi:sensor histidine kinase [Actinoallomurus soli]|uniref:sensor histidine kinase n=1 Tax=Actinoallomurus soli TaxID=2952535 RepID=UPI002093467D|nr:histidine kinase [Actinoallomurus soli]MCO5973797.1 histidine kinase [Actinoallomurus soli]